MKQLALSLDSVTALAREVHEVKNGCTQVSESSDGLHLDRVHFF